MRCMAGGEAAVQAMLVMSMGEQHSQQSWTSAGRQTTSGRLPAEHVQRRCNASVEARRGRTVPRVNRTYCHQCTVVAKMCTDICKLAYSELCSAEGLTPSAPTPANPIVRPISRNSPRGQTLASADANGFSLIPFTVLLSTANSSCSLNIGV